MIPDLQTEGAVGNIDFLVALHCADQYPHLQRGVQVTENHAVQLAARAHRQRHDLGAALGERLPFQERRVLQQTENFLGGGAFRVHRHT